MICETARPAGPATLSTANMACFREPSSSRASDSCRGSSGGSAVGVVAAWVVDVAAALASLEFGPGAGAAVASCAAPVEPEGGARRWRSCAGFKAVAAAEGLLTVASSTPALDVPVGT